jgi:hypothetical protein
VDEHEHRRARLLGRKDVERFVEGGAERLVEDAAQPLAGVAAAVDVVPRLGGRVGHPLLGAVFGVDLRGGGELTAPRSSGVAAAAPPRG